MKRTRLTAATLLAFVLTLGLMWLAREAPATANAGPRPTARTAKAPSEAADHLSGPTAPAGRITVNTSNDELDLLSPNGRCSLREALGNANDNSGALADCSAGTGDDTVSLPAGKFVLSIDDPGSDNVGAEGDLDVTDDHALTIRGAGPDQTIIDADGIDRVLDIRPGAGPVVISDLTLTGGSLTRDGGALYNDDADVTLVNVIVRENMALNGGGTYVHESAATLTLDGVVVHENGARGNGGGIFVNAGTVTMTDTQVLTNVADSYGGGLHVRSGTATLTGTDIAGNAAVQGAGVYVEETGAYLSTAGTTLRDNSAAFRGGGLLIESATATISDSRILSNTASWNGGGVSVVTGTVTMMATDLVSNTALHDHGGGLLVEYGTAAMTDTVVMSNRAKEGNGGGIYVSDSAARASVSAARILSNTADHGGGLYVYSGELLITSSTIEANAASMEGSALYLRSPGSITVTDSCIFGNSDTAVYNHPFSGGSLVATANWWGAANGPSGVGPGDGDSVSDRVDYEPFMTSPPAPCPCDVGLSKTVHPSILDPGAAITYTLAFSNACRTHATDIVITDTVPISITRASLGYTYTGATVLARTGTAYVWDVDDLAPSQAGVITVTGVLTPDLRGGSLLQNTAVLATSAVDPDDANNTSSASVEVREVWHRLYLPVVVRG